MDDYCELCDLPRSTCIHGRPPTVATKPAKPVKPVRAAKGAPKPRRAVPPARVVARRWTPPEVFKPLILEVLREAGGALEADDLFLELEIRAEDLLLPGDGETTPQGELRWRYAARRARVALIDEGLMVQGRGGSWKLAR